MPAFILLATERSTSEGASVDTLRDAMQRASLTYGQPGARSRYGDWLAPMARVTRDLDLQMSGRDPVTFYVTKVADLYGIPDRYETNQQAMERMLQELIVKARAELNRATGSDWTLHVDLWDEAVNGPLEYWVSGEAAHSPHWQSEYPYSGRPDNPIGPNHGDQGSDTRIAVDDWIQEHDPSNANFDLGIGSFDWDKIVNALTWVGGGALVLFLVWQVVQASRQSREPA